MATNHKSDRKTKPTGQTALKTDTGRHRNTYLSRDPVTQDPVLKLETLTHNCWCGQV